MGLSSSMNAGVAGLSVNSTRLSGISDNIANSDTFGYKRVETDFIAMVTQQSSAGYYEAGGVRASVKRSIDVNGALISTGNSTDISIRGEGLLPVTDNVSRDQIASERPLKMVTTGSFTKDQKGFLTTDSGFTLLGWPTDEGGNIGNVARESANDLVPVRVTGFEFATNPTTKVELGMNLPAADTEAGSTGDPYLFSVEYYDTLGGAQTLDMTFTPTPAAAGAPPTGQWNLSVLDSATGAAVIADVDLQFFGADDGVSAGTLETVTANTGTYDGATGTLTVATLGGDVDIDIGRIGTATNLSQYSSSFAPVSINKDGTPIGSLNRLEVTQEGFLQGIYDTGFRRTIYQLPVASVPNLNALAAVDSQSFELTAESGPLYLWDAGDGPVGAVEGYTREQSTVDIATELTQLIRTQRAYSSNAKIIQTVDEMLQETTNLKR